MSTRTHSDACPSMCVCEYVSAVLLEIEGRPGERHAATATTAGGRDMRRGACSREHVHFEGPRGSAGTRQSASMLLLPLRDALMMRFVKRRFFEMSATGNVTKTAGLACL